MYNDELLWLDLAEFIVGDGSDQEKWPPGTDLIDACKIEIKRLRSIENETIQKNQEYI